MHLCWIRELKQRAKYFPSCIHVLLLPRDNCLRGLYLAMNYCSGNPMPNCFLSILVMATSPSVLTLYSMAILSCRLRDKATPPFHPSPVLSWLQTKHSGSLARQWWGPPEVLVSALQKGIGDWEPLGRREELMGTGQGIWPAWNVMLGDREGVKVIGSPKTATISFCLCLKCRLLSIVSLKCVPMQNPLGSGRGDGWFQRWMKEIWCFLQNSALLCKKQTTCLLTYLSVKLLCSHSATETAISFTGSLFAAVSLRWSSPPEDWASVAAGLGEEEGSALGSRGQDPEWSEMRF